MKISNYRIGIVVLLSCMFFNCARRGSPTGGLKDTIPPIMIKAIPEIETVNFESKKIKIYFDEYIKLNEVKQQLVISPPAKNDPVISPVGTASKFITIKIMDTLDPNTTYLYSFGKSIVDNNEANELGGFKYVFSTGTFIDSLNVEGKVTDPMVKESATDIDVMLYEYNDSYTDSIIFKEKPRYITNTLDSTLFNITNLKAGKYLLIALKDENNNKIYEPKFDKIGYIEDTLVIPTQKTFDFTLFKEIQELKFFRPIEVHKGHLYFGFEGDAKDIDIKILSPTPENYQSFINVEKGKDTINYWYTPFQADSLVFEVSKGSYKESFTFNPRETEIDTLKITPSTSSVLHLRDTFSISSNTPITTIDKSFIKIEKDSIPVEFSTILSKNSSKLYINFEKDLTASYKLEILPNLVKDVFGFTNDSLSVNLQTKTREDYGSLIMDVVSNLNSGFIIELLDEKENVIRSISIDKPEKVNFNLLPPGTYLVRAIYDTNRNGKWDTGNFLERRQAEKVLYSEVRFELRANHDVEQPFNLN